MAAPAPPSTIAIDAPARRLPPAFLFVLLPLVVTGAIGTSIISFALLTVPEESSVFASSVVSYTVNTFAVGMPLMTAVLAWLVLPYHRLRSALARGEDPKTFSAADLRRSLHLPVYFFALILVEWTISALLWPLYQMGVEAADATWVSLTSFTIIVCNGYLAAVLTFYALYLIIQRVVAPKLLPFGDISVVGAFRPVRIYHHLYLLTMTLGVVSPLLAVCFVFGGVTNPQRSILLLGLVMLVVGVVQAGSVTSALSRPAGQLEGRMADVQVGDFHVMAKVSGLDTFGRLSSSFNAMVEGLRQRERIRETFGRYVTQQVAEVILAGEVALGGERRTATVLFSDIRGFTHMSEQLAPEEVVEFLNRYLDLMVDCVLDAGGTLDKFIGDAVMAVFGVPTSRGVEEDARAAVRCALAMSACLDALNEERTRSGAPAIEIGIGVHTGPVVAGNIGSQKRMEYTVIGDTVNLTSRLESMTKTLKRRIVISEAVAAHLGDAFTLEELDEITVRGREQKVRVYDVRRAA